MSTILRKTILTLLASLTILAGTAVVGSSPASAAAAGAPDVRGCFSYYNGKAYDSAPLHLQQLTRSGWVTIRTGRSAADGCGTFRDVPAGSYVRITAYWSYAVGSRAFYYLGDSRRAYSGHGNVLRNVGHTRVGGPYVLY